MIFFFRDHILKQHQQETEYLEAVTFALDQLYAGIDSEARQNYQSTRDDIKNRVLYLPMASFTVKPYCRIYL